jgi:hypothetical protein
METTSCQRPCARIRFIPTNFCPCWIKWPTGHGFGDKRFGQQLFRDLKVNVLSSDLRLEFIPMNLCPRLD